MLKDEDNKVLFVCTDDDSVLDCVLRFSGIDIDEDSTVVFIGENDDNISDRLLNVPFVPNNVVLPSLVMDAACSNEVPRCEKAFV